MKLNVEIKNLYAYWRHSTKEWVVCATIWTDNVSQSIDFSARKLNKAKKKFYEWCTQGMLGEEMKQRFRQHEIEIPATGRDWLSEDDAKLFQRLYERQRF